MKPSRSVRAPAVAGLFYPAAPEALARAVDTLLAQARSDSPGHAGRTHLVVSPHAGYAYSGAVAARAFALLERGSFETVVLIGPSHVDAFGFTSVFDGDAYQTPLGLLEVDHDVARRLGRATTVRLSPRGHAVPTHARGEHGLEVLLPFLQRACGSPRIVPVVMGSQDWNACETLGRTLAEEIDGERTLLVASSDLSHFHRYEEVVRRDRVFCDLLTTLDAARVHEAVSDGRCEACGAGPVVAALIAAEGWEQRRCRVLACLNSGDVTGERDSVVGYASAVVTTPDGDRLAP